MNAPNRRRRILVVEDETSIAIMLEQCLSVLGYAVVGPVSKLSAALALAASEDLDAALLDVTIRGGDVFPVAEILRTRRIPFVLASGYGKWALPASLREAPRLTKPFSMDEMETQISQLFQTAE
jgi:DNA-binding response OmpR family regulator